MELYLILVEFCSWLYLFIVIAWHKLYVDLKKKKKKKKKKEEEEEEDLRLFISIIYC